MPKKKNKCVCETLAGSKTTILVIEKEKNTSKKLNEYLKNSGFNSIIKMHSSQGLKNIKSHDIYVVEYEEAPIEYKAEIIKKIYKSNPKACVFLLGETEEKKTIISKEVRPYIDPIKLGVVFEPNISKNDEELNNVIQYILSIENTKNKLTCLWQKLEIA